MRYLSITLVLLLAACGGDAPSEQRVDTAAPGKADTDGPTHGPGAVFVSIDAAALDARLHCIEQDDPSVEYGGWISQVEGGYTYFSIYRGTAGSVEIPYSKVRHLLLGYVAAFHTHPKKPFGTSSTELFSDKDIAFADDLYHDKGVRPAYFYLFTPWGKILRYDPGRVKTTWLKPAPSAPEPAADVDPAPPEEPADETDPADSDPADDTEPADASESPER